MMVARVKYTVTSYCSPVRSTYASLYSMGAIMEAVSESARHAATGTSVFCSACVSNASAERLAAKPSVLPATPANMPSLDFV